MVKDETIASIVKTLNYKKEKSGSKPTLKVPEQASSINSFAVNRKISSSKYKSNLLQEYGRQYKCIEQKQDKNPLQTAVSSEKAADNFLKPNSKLEYKSIKKVKYPNNDKASCKPKEKGKKPADPKEQEARSFWLQSRKNSTQFQQLLKKQEGQQKETLRAKNCQEDKQSIRNQKKTTEIPKKDSEVSSNSEFSSSVFKSKLLQQNSLIHFVPPETRKRNETSEERELKKR
mmetsp:Transcript_12793/g.14591  ORF Transcript_12793/g.14591 Transcript_12793/m.14591 type:complete len:231 (-) Transcript_12793:720-1412(-)|eukprot:CAMPEP_0168321566 /NCGR_PEP_ID=MMETSP0213-20121227/2357_1 /TAXON_ID=151035 /ORGANISM="Euplotes harpa, Strain FSP1.4" /LENGTH=230 /DNA_ID=CAMNT_0008323261 /DNA_START=791 /DNA_END=1483 /DNA_ORIENTATION=+